jgi:general secretion pathway protein M
MNVLKSYKGLLTSPMSYGLSFVASVSVALAIGIYCGFDIASTLAERASLSETLSQYASREAASARTAASLAERDQIFLRGVSGSITQAELLKHISKQIASESGVIISSSIDDAALAAPNKDHAIRIRTEFKMNNDHLQALLYKIESGIPYLFVDNLVLRPAPEAGSRDLLHAQMTIYGQWRGR